MNERMEKRVLEPGTLVWSDYHETIGIIIAFIIRGTWYDSPGETTLHAALINGKYHEIIRGHIVADARERHQNERLE